MCEGRRDEMLTREVLETISDKPDQEESDLTSESSATVEGYLGDNWGLGFAQRPHYE